MQFSDLPADLIQLFFDVALHEWGLWHAVRFRLISKLFDEQIRLAVCRTRYLERYPYPRSARKLVPNEELRQQYLEHVVSIGNPGGLRLARAISDIVGALEQRRMNRWTIDKSDRISALCAAGVADCSPTRWSWLSLESEDDPPARSNIDLTEKNNLLVGAVVCGELLHDLSLLNEVEDAFSCNYFFGTPLACAAFLGSTAMVDVLLEHGARDRGSPGKLAITMAALNRHDAIVRRLLEVHDRFSDVESDKHLCPDNYNEPSAFSSMLSAAIEGGHTSVINLLLDSDLAKKHTATRCHALRSAIKGGHAALLPLIDADPARYRDSHELWYSSWLKDTPGAGRDLAIVKWFLEKGSAAHGDVEECVYLAAQKNRLEIVRFVAEQPGFLWFSPTRALCTAARNGCYDVARFLVNHYHAERRFIDDYSIRHAIEFGFDSILHVLWPIIPGPSEFEEFAKEMTEMLQDFVALAAVYHNHAGMRTLLELCAPYRDLMCGTLTAKVTCVLAQEHESEHPKYKYRDFSSPFCPKAPYVPTISYRSGCKHTS